MWAVAGPNFGRLAGTHLAPAALREVGHAFCDTVRTQGLSNQPRTIALRSDWSSVRALVCGQRAEERRRNRPAEPANPKAKGGVPSMLTRDKSAPASLGGSAGMGAGRLQRPGMA